MGLPVQVHHRGQRGARLVQLAQLPGRDAGAPLHRAHQQPLVHGLRQLADLTEPVQVAAQRAVVAQRAQQVEHGRLVDALRVPQGRGDEAGLVVQPAQRLVERGEAVRAELVRPRRHVPRRPGAAPSRPARRSSRSAVPGRPPARPGPPRPAAGRARTPAPGRAAGSGCRGRGRSARPGRAPPDAGWPRPRRWRAARLPPPRPSEARPASASLRSSRRVGSGWSV